MDTAAPAVTLGARPVNNTTDSTPTFTFTGDPGATFECQLLPSISAFAPCTSPKTFAAQIDGDYTFNVRAVDLAGNVSGAASFAWEIGAAVTRLSDFNRDGRTDLVARDSAGRLWLYQGIGSGGFLPRRLMATGWNVFTAIVSPGDVTGDGNADVLARNKAGALRLYPGNGRGGFTASRLIGASGWNAMTMITGAGLMSGDAKADLLARDAAGKLWLYRGRWHRPLRHPHPGRDRVEADDRTAHPRQLGPHRRERPDRPRRLRHAVPLPGQQRREADPAPSDRQRVAGYTIA